MECVQLPGVETEALAAVVHAGDDEAWPGKGWKRENAMLGEEAQQQRWRGGEGAA